MSNQPVIPPQNDEVDIIQFFQWIGRGFFSIWKGLTSFFVFLFNILVYKPFYYFKKYRKLAVPLIVLAFLMGILADSFKSPVYQSEILISPNYDSGKEIFTRIDEFNSLIGDEKFDELAGKLHIPVEDAQAFLSFEIEPNFNERIDAKTYTEFVSFIDTTVTQELDFEKYRKSFVKQEFDYPQLIVTVKAKRPEVFKNLNKFFENLLENEPLFVQRRKVKLKTMDDQIQFVTENIAQLDSLRTAINAAIKNMGKGQTPENSVIVGAAQVNFPEKKYDLFTKRQELVSDLTKLRQDRVDMQKIVLMNSSFPDYAPVYNPVWMQYKFSFVISMFILLVIVFYLIDLMIYLNRRYEKAKKQLSQ